MSQQIQLRRDAAAVWTSVNPVLAQGEIGVETDTGKAKAGDGVTAWASLGYWKPDGAADGVASVFGRSGAVTAQTGDYTAAQVGADASGAAAAVLASSAQKSANLSDLASASTARTNLGLGSAAVHASTDFDAAGAAAAAAAASVPLSDLPLSLANGGTGQTAQQAALDALAGAVTSGQVLRGNGTHVTLAAIQAGDVPTLNQNTTGTAAGLSSTLAVGSGGTGQATQQAAINALTGTQSSGKFLRSDGTNAALAAIQAGDVPTLNQSTSGTAAGLSSTLAIGSGGTGSTTRNFAGLLTPTAVKTSAYSAAAGDYVPVDTTSGAVAITLPSAPADLTVIGIKMVIQGGTSTVTYNASGSDVFNKAGGATSGTLTLLSQGVLLQYKASGGIWYVFADDLPLSQLDTRYGLRQVQSVDALGADHTGVTDCTAIFNTALGNLPTITINAVTYPYGTIEFGAGAYRLGSSIDTTSCGPLVRVRGQGRYATYLYYYGSGRCLRFQNPAGASSVANTVMAGGFEDFTVDGSNAGAGAIGVMYGDMNGGRFDACIQHFNLAGSVGLQLVNAVWDTEKTKGYARLIDNTTGAQFTVTDGPSVTSVTLVSAVGGTATFTVASGGFPGFYVGMKLYGSAGLTTPVTSNVSTMTTASISGNTLTCSYTGTAPSGASGTLTICSSTQSFDYDDFEFSIFTTGGVFTAGSPGTYAGQEGVLFSNGANPAGGRLVIRGNFAQSNANPWTGTAPAILRLDGAMLANHPTQGATYFSDQDILLQAEGDPANATYQVYPVRFSGSAAGAGAHGFSACKGLMYFSGAADASLGSAPFSFAGPVQGIPSLNRTNIAGGNTGAGTGAQSYFDSGRPVDTAGRAYQQVTGLLGANNPFTLAGAVTGAAPASGTFSTNDVALDLTLGGWWLCTSGGTSGTWQYMPGSPPAVSGSLGGDVLLSGETTVLTTASLATGTWKVDVGLTIEQETASSFSVYECRVNGGTATYTATGATSAEGFSGSNGTVAQQVTHLHLSFLAVVTVAGTLIITAKNSAGAGTPNAKAATTITSYGGATGYAAIKVA